MKTLFLLIPSFLFIISCSELPEENEFKINFNNSKNIMNQLMAKYESCQSNGEPFVWLSSKSVNSNNCKELLKEANLNGISSSANETYSFYPKNGHGSKQVTYKYTTSTISIIYPSLNKAVDTAKPYEEAHIQLENNWYLVYVCLCG